METAFREQAGGVLVLDELHLLPGLFRNRLLKLLESPGPRLCIGTLNRCRCGRTGVPGARCLCTGYQQAQFQALLSEALLDRVPLHAQCEYVHDRAPASSVGAIFAETILRVRRAPRGLVWDAAALSLFERAINQFGLSFRAEEHARRVCETIALVENKQVIGADQVHEAL
jgi:predicted ATPase with chaperone activity